jgi:3-dehydroquinate synthase
LAARLGVPFSDSDDVIVAVARKSIPEIFAAEGEAVFRKLEAEVIATELQQFAGVLALGGGAVMTPETQANLATYVEAGGEVVYLDMNAQVVLERIAGGGRPLLEGPDCVERWQALASARQYTYRKVATIQLDTTALDLDEVVEALSVQLAGRVAQLPGRVAQLPRRVAQLPSQGAELTRVTVNLAEPYEVVIGRGAVRELPAMLRPGVNKVLAIYPEPLKNLARPTIDVLQEAGYVVIEQQVPDAEAQKTAAVLELCWQTAGLNAITRSDAVVGIGGGATTDLAGFVAASWLRGIQVVHVSTTLLGMVDAAVGGKTGINTSEGKNLVGAFHQPAGVICDLAALETLSARDFSAGLAEVIKCGFIADPQILELVAANSARLHPWPGWEAAADVWAVVAELVERAVRVKAEVTAEDPTEKGKREFLNYGHTLGHAIELAEHYQWRHGEAVAVGMVFAAELAQQQGLLSVVERDRHRSLLKAVGLPTKYHGATLAELLPAMQRDKKARGATMRFVVLDGIGAPTRLIGPTISELEAAFAEIS